MKKYRVQFFYNTDLRCEWEGESRDEVSAVAAAMYHHKIDEWCTLGNAFVVKISLPNAVVLAPAGEKTPTTKTDV